jgi:hypothetical protein
VLLASRTSLRGLRPLLLQGLSQLISELVVWYYSPCRHINATNNRNGCANRRKLKMSSKETTPGVFIIESTTLVDEEEGRQEGDALRAILQLAKRNVIYRYVRTEKELRKFLDQFHRSRFRYLHLACHGNDEEIGLTLSSSENLLIYCCHS